MNWFFGARTATRQGSETSWGWAETSPINLNQTQDSSNRIHLSYFHTYRASFLMDINRLQRCSYESHRQSRALNGSRVELAPWGTIHPQVENNWMVTFMSKQNSNHINQLVPQNFFTDLFISTVFFFNKGYLRHFIKP